MPRTFLRVLLTAVLAGAALTGTAPPSSAALATTVTVNAGQSLATVPDTLVGANHAVWDGYLASATTSTQVRDAGIKYLRFPGGSYSDAYHWQSHTAENGGYIAPNTSFDHFMTATQTSNAKAIVTTNYGSGTAQEAADWVRYANITKGYGVKYWEIGNENFGNGHYGTAWEWDTHADKSPRAYGTAAVQYITAMKAIDPTIKVGIVLTTPGHWPDGLIGPGDSADWNDTVMSIVGNRADFAIFHWYPYDGGTSEADMLTKPQTAASVVSQFRADLDRHGATGTQIFVTELNGGPPRNTQPQALWSADVYLSLAEAGVKNVDWWNIHNGSGGTATDSTGATDYRDEGIISNGSGSEPAAHTPFRTYYGIQMLSKVAAPGDTLIRTSSGTAKVTAHAVRRADGSLSVLLINKDNTNPYTVNLAYTGFQPDNAVTVDTYGLTSTSITRSTVGTATSQTIPPYGLVAVHVRPGNGDPGDPEPTCKVTYKTNDWGTGFNADVTIANPGTTAISGWTLKWAFAGNQRISGGWNANVTQSGAQVTARDAGYNATIPAGGTVSFGFQASYSGANASPTAFQLGDSVCAIA